ncbi:peptidoglycan-binding domain-containing protein [Streptomyces adustus]|nr:peptidoglycan-binding domain-containing protein [Streptomyces adustus]
MRFKLTGAVLATAVALGGGLVAAPSASAATVRDCKYTTSEPTLRYGATGSAVQQLQCELNYSLNWENFPAMDEDGIWGDITQSRVVKFQSCAGLSVDGAVGPKTWAKLDYWAANADWLPCNP